LLFVYDPERQLRFGRPDPSTREDEQPMDVIEATTNYETWLGSFCVLYGPDVAYKHEQLANPTDPFPFFRGTYYRWAQLWPASCPDVMSAPRVLAVGDLHVENFGTWRDADGRLCWGVNDFDEADELPYTNDLVRLAASARFARKSGALNVKTAVACQAILDGYRSALSVAGTPFVLEEHHPELRLMATVTEREPSGATWERFTEVCRAGEDRSLVAARTVWVLLDAATGRPRRVDAGLVARFAGVNAPGGESAVG
jgi:hypothetical protein